MKFYKCDVCGKIITMMEDKPVPTVCCNQTMEELVPGSTDAATEKHLPVIVQDGNTVTIKVGEIAHPMMEKHYIKWVILETNQGFSRKELKPQTEPSAVFALADGEEVIAAYEFCNLHGLWKQMHK